VGKNIVVDIADMAIATSKDDILVTYSLGSCLGIAIYDPVAGIGGLMHCMLPLSSVDPEKAKDRPFMFVDTGMTIMLTQLFEAGLVKANTVIKVAGGAKLLDKNDLFRIGERNYTVFRKFLWKNGLMIKAENVGGDITRTVRLEMATGRFLIKSSGSEWEI